ncbi:MAG: pentapeptide repeat-containing protein, partial [Chlamydiia bacterium]|nr:pentapeptide repeat-containing protein [Chlamydiia bacterium]
LEGALFEDADLTHARFQGATVKKADFRGAKGITEEVRQKLEEKGALF